jgi:branched-chain amino acid aminotransferase
MNLADRDGVIWLDGEMVPWREAKIHVLTHTLHYGLGVFEGVRAYETPNHGTCIFRLQEHTDRLFRSAHILTMDMPFDKETINQAQRDVVRENNLVEGYLRPMCFYGSEGMGLRADNLKTHVMVAAWEWPSYMEPEAAELGIRVRTSSYTRHHVNITMCKAKANGNYINSILALQEAQQCGCEEALLLDNEASVTAKSKRGETPIDVVSAAWSPEIEQTYTTIGNLVGVKLSFERIRETRPVIAERLRQQ